MAGSFNDDGPKKHWAKSIIIEANATRRTQIGTTGSGGSEVIRRDHQIKSASKEMINKVVVRAARCIRAALSMFPRGSLYTHEKFSEYGVLTYFCP